MTWVQGLELGASIVLAISAFGTLVLSFVNFRKLEQVHVQINSRMDQLLTTAGLLGQAEGRAEIANKIAPVDNIPR